ncbi:uncharacterized protein LOC124142768 [Haliotis rufescens]|uniref:uncharacterized protein LOC124142768 n=1 Tax=Haliotis rufescens TaxID=6454 RepID=UPI00201EC9C9|nr:uncharacterized protein LOC124142768 [Haliotis rufescens]
MVTTCCVPGCKNRFNKGSSREFYRIPCDLETRTKWTLAIFEDANLTPSNYSRICGDHFITGMRSTDPTHPDHVPSLFPTTTTQEHQLLKDQYTLFRKKQEKSLSAASNDLHAVNQLWLEKGWKQDSIDKLFSDDTSPKSHNPIQTHTPNPLTNTLTQPQPPKDYSLLNFMHSPTNQKAPEEFLVLDRGFGQRKMVVRLSRPVKYVSTTPPTQAGQDIRASMKDGIYQYVSLLDNTNETPKLKVPVIPVKKDKCIQVDAYVDAPYNNSPEELSNVRLVEGMKSLATVQEGSSQVEACAGYTKNSVREVEDEASSVDKSVSAAADSTEAISACGLILKNSDSFQTGNEPPFSVMENGMDKCAQTDYDHAGQREETNTSACAGEESGKILTVKEIGPDCDQIQYTSAMDHAYHHNGLNRPMEIHISKSYTISSNAMLCSSQTCIDTSSNPVYKYEYRVVFGQNVVKRRKCLKDVSTQTDGRGCKAQVMMEAERLTLVEEMLQLHDKVVARSYTMDSFQSNQEKVQFYTGFSNFETLMGLFDSLLPHMCQRTQQGPDPFELFVLTLIKLRLGIKMKDIAYQTVITTAKLCTAVTQWFNLMYCCLSPLIDLPDPKYQTLSFFLEKINRLKSRYFILQHVQSNLKSSDSWLMSKGVKDVVVVCDVLSQFYVAGEGDSADVDMKDIRDPFQLPEPQSEEESLESESSDAESDAGVDAVAEDIDDSNTEDVLTNIEDRQKRGSIHLDMQISGSFGDDLSMSSNNYSHQDELGSCSVDRAVISRTGLDSVSSCSRSTDSVNFNQSTPLPLETLQRCAGPSHDVMDVDTPAGPGDNSWSAPQVSVNTLHKTISFLGTRLHTGKDVGMEDDKDSQSEEKSSEKNIVLTWDISPTVSPEITPSKKLHPGKDVDMDDDKDSQSEENPSEKNIVLTWDISPTVSPEITPSEKLHPGKDVDMEDDKDSQSEEKSSEKNMVLTWDISPTVSPEITPSKKLHPGKDVDMEDDKDSQSTENSSENKTVLKWDISPESFSSKKKHGKKLPFVLGDHCYFQDETPESVQMDNSYHTYCYQDHDNTPHCLEKRLEIMETVINDHTYLCRDKTADNRKILKKGRLKSRYFDNYDHAYSCRDKRIVERTPQSVENYQSHGHSQVLTMVRSDHAYCVDNSTVKMEETVPDQ